MIPVNEPIISKEAVRYVNDALKSGWISSAGKYISLFEEAFARYLNTKYAITVTNGTAALHLALAALGIGKGDEVIIPDLTIISCAFAVIYTGAVPVFVDVDPQTGNMDPSKIQEKITKRTKAIMPVHLYGHPAEMKEIMNIGKRNRLYIVEDAAEAHGAEYKMKGFEGQTNADVWKKVGSLGDIGCFSFYANKIVTTGEGGMILTNDDSVNKKARILKDLAHSPLRRFLHEELGFNYRMTNIQAALGLGELTHIDKYIKKKRWMAEKYRQLLSDIPDLELPSEAEYAKNVYWMYAVTVKRDSKITKDSLRLSLKRAGIDTRDFFLPLHSQPVLKEYVKDNSDAFPVSVDLSQRGFYLPSGLAITETQIQNVSKQLKNIFNDTK